MNVYGERPPHTRIVNGMRTALEESGMLKKDNQSLAAGLSTSLKKPDSLIIRPSAFSPRAQGLQHLGEAVQLQ